MKNSADLGGCYPPRPSASVDNTLLDLQNSSYPTQPHSIIAKYLVGRAHPQISSSPGLQVGLDLRVTSIRLHAYYRAIFRFRV